MRGAYWPSSAAIARYASSRRFCSRLEAASSDVAWERMRQAVDLEPWARNFSEEAGPLVRICGDVTPPGDQYWGLAFIFENRTLTLSCNEDTDEIVVEPHERDLSALHDVSDDQLFQPLVGKHIEHLWWMTNHRGYGDGFQMRLLDFADRSEATRQFEVGASAMYVRVVG
jgi:hypothetical protein